MTHGPLSYCYWSQPADIVAKQRNEGGMLAASSAGDLREESNIVWSDDGWGISKLDFLWVWKAGGCLFLEDGRDFNKGSWKLWEMTANLAQALTAGVTGGWCCYRIWYVTSCPYGISPTVLSLCDPFCGCGVIAMSYTSFWVSRYMVWVTYQWCE